MYGMLTTRSREGARRLICQECYARVRHAEVYIGGTWFTTDARFHIPRIGRIKISCGQDAVDGAFSTIYGAATLSYFQVWAYQVARGSVGIGDPIDLTRRLDNQWTVRTDAHS